MTRPFAFINKTSLLVAVVLFAGVSSSHGADKPNLDFFELPLEALIDVMITTPSKSAQALADTPGIVTTLTEKEIALFGGRDLGEVLSRVLGFDEFASLVIGRNMVTMRGDQPNVNNNHVLFLLNGVPLNRESYTGGIWNQSMLLSIPLDTIQQLEVVRGPGSVLYGTNAFAGVVNIITKTAQQLQSKLSVSWGQDDTQIVNLNLAGEHGAWQWTSAMRWFESNGWPFNMTEATGELFKDDAFSRSPGLIATVKNKGFSANVFWGKAEQFTIRSGAANSLAGRTDNEKYAINFGYETDLNSLWSLTTHLSHVAGRTDHQVASVVPGQLQTIHYKTDDSRLEITAKGNLSAASSVVIGGTVDYFSGSTPAPTVIVSDWHDYLAALYGQYEVSYGDTKYIFGAQYNRAETGYDRLVPRLGLIHHINEQSGIKLLYGQAYRAPYVTEREIDAVTPNLSIKGDENLAPELVTTWDLQYFYASNGLTAAATLFRNEQEDLIIRDPVALGRVVFANKGELVIEGLELEAKYTRNNWYFNAGFTQQRNKDGNGVDDYTLQPDQILKLGLGYDAVDWSIGIFDRYLSGYQGNDVINPSRLILNPEPEAHHRLSVNISYHGPEFRTWAIEAYFDNLLNVDLYLPVQQGDPSPLNTYPALAGRFFMLTINKAL